jgi:hypothetical protein
MEGVREVGTKGTVYRDISCGGGRFSKKGIKSYHV